MRLIDADALHDALREKQKWVVRYGDKHSEGYTSDQVHFAINDAPTVEERQKGNWIPCSERLPDKDGDYLITYDESYANDYDYDRLVSIAPFEVASEAFGYWYQHLGTNGWVGEDWIGIPVVAWMPLPEPYRGDNE